MHPRSPTKAAQHLPREAPTFLADGTTSISSFGPVRLGARIPKLKAVINLRRPLWREPRAVGASPVERANRLLVVGFAVAVLVEGATRPGVAWRPLVTALALAVVPALLWRRRHPLLTTVGGWSAPALLSILQVTVHPGDLNFLSMMAVLILLWSLVRWGSGREIAWGTAFVAVVAALGFVATFASWGEVFGGSVLMLLVVALGVLARYRADLWDRQRLGIRNQERVALARELHDTVAHHVSAIAVQAQAGGVVARMQPDRAVDVLATIEAEASRTLAEMRTMVRVLRGEEAVEFAPQLGVADLPALARADGMPTVEVWLDGSLSRLGRPVDAALYRLAQESLTNAVRHARGATRIKIGVRREGLAVRLLVTDDGRTEPGYTPEPGFGLLGMAERAQLLGGSLTARPAPGGGWVVEAVLPVEVLS